MLPCGVDVDGSCTKQMWIKMYIGAVMHRPLEGDRNLFIFVINTIHLGEEKRLKRYFLKPGRIICHISPFCSKDLLEL